MHLAPPRISSQVALVHTDLDRETEEVIADTLQVGPVGNRMGLAGTIAVSGSDLLMVPTLGPMVKGYFPGNIQTDHGVS